MDPELVKKLHLLHLKHDAAKLTSLARRRKGWTSLRVPSDPFAQEFYEKMGAIKVDDSPAPVAGTDRSLSIPGLPISL